jgi:glucose-6-phosphate 1-dehydrogenase
VPFYIRTGKCLPTTQTEARLVFRRPPRLGFVPRDTRRPEAGQLAVKLDPSTGIQLIVDAKRGDVRQPESITLDMEFAEQGGEAATPYEVLLDAAMRGDAMRFTRQDAVEEQWRIMQPLLDAPPPVQPYAKGTWGPAAADDLPAASGGWRTPWVAS